MNYRNILKCALALLPALALTSCDDSFMDRQPQSEIGMNSFFNTEEDLAMYCYNLYDFGGLGIYTDDSGTDNQATTDMTELKNMMQGANPNSNTVTGGWSWGRLRAINIFLDHCDRAKVAPEVLAHYKGIARFFRAAFYMDKVKRYSDVPWIESEVSTTDDILFGSRDPRTAVVDKIFADYQYAADNVYSKKVAGGVTRWVVLAYMARHALYEGTFRKYHPELNLQATAPRFLEMAAKAAKTIMDEGGFSIYNTGKPEADYHTLFESLDLTTNPEVILARVFERNTLENGFWAFMFGNYIPCPTRDLLQSYLMKDGSFYSAQPGYQTHQFVEEFKDRDPRLSQTYAYPGWELIKTETYAPGAGIYVQNFSKYFTGYHQIKGFVNNKNQDVYLAIDVPILRYAEVLLTYAEAKAELGTITASDLDATVNLLRNRAGMPSMTLSPAVDPVIAADFPGASPLICEIRRERRVEMALEGQRHDDLMRWHAGKLLERVPEGLYFPSLGKFDLTGDDVPDIYLIPASADIPAEADKESNSLGKKLVYYRAGSLDESASTIFLSEGNKGRVLTSRTMGQFREPQFYYRPVPRRQTDLNPALLPQLFGWE